MTHPGPRPDRRGVLAAGSIVVDVGKVIDHYPPRERIALIETISLSTGGPGLNLAMDLARLGAGYPIDLVGAVGDDAHGEFVLARCAEAGIGTGGVRTVTGAATSFTDAMVERDGGRRTFFHHVGANDLFDPADVDVSATGAAILHCGAPGLHALADAPDPGDPADLGDPADRGNAGDAGDPGAGNGWSALLRRAQAAGLRTNLELVSIDAARVRALASPCLPHLDSLIINEIEAGAITGIDLEAPALDGPVDWATLERVASGLVDRGVGLVVVHFPAGCVAADRSGRTWRQGSVRLAADQVVSTTGAGDAFAAGVVHGLHEGLPVDACLRQGAAVAAACVRGAGTSDGIRPVADCLAVAEAAGFRTTGVKGANPGGPARRG